MQLLLGGAERTRWCDSKGVLTRAESGVEISRSGSARAIPLTDPVAFRKCRVSQKKTLSLSIHIQTSEQVTVHLWIVTYGGCWQRDRTTKTTGSVPSSAAWNSSTTFMQKRNNLSNWFNLNFHNKFKLDNTLSSQKIITKIYKRRGGLGRKVCIFDHGTALISDWMAGSMRSPEGFQAYF